MKNLGKNFDFILCDSKSALLRYKNKVDLNNTLIKTSSPAILLDKTFKTEHIEKKWSLKKFLVFQDSIYNASKECFNILKKEKSLSKQEQLFFSTVIADYFRFLYKASCLDKSFLNKKILLINMSPEAKLAEHINPPWEILLRNKANLIKKLYKPEGSLFHKSINKNTEKANLLSRIYLGGIETFVYRICINSSKINLFNKKIFILAENELLIEKTYEFIANKYSLNKILDFNDNAKKPYNVKQINKVIFLTKNLLKKTISRHVNKNFHAEAYNHFVNNIKKKSNAYYQHLHFYRRYIENVKNIDYKKSLLFMGTPSSLKSLACTQAFQEKKIKSITFQHGVTAEISETHKFNRVFHSSSNGDFFVAFNKTSARIAKKNIFSNSLPIICSLPKRYNRQKLFIKKIKYRIR